MNKNIMSFRDLSSAIKRSNVTEVRRIIPSMQRASKAEAGRLMHLAVRLASTGVVKIMAHFKLGLNVRDELGNSPLITAVLVGSYHKVKVLIDAGAPLNAKNQCGETPLSSAAAYGKISILRLLLRTKSHIDNKDNHGATALLWAASGGHLDAFKALVRAGARLSVFDKMGNGVASHAVWSGKPTLVDECLNLLNGRAFKIKNKIGLSALDYAERGKSKRLWKMIADRCN